MGNSTREISNFIEDMYGFAVSTEMISNITDKIIPEMEEWKSRRLEEVYPFVYIDAIHFNVKENGVIGKKVVYIAMGISKEGIKEAIQIAFPNTEHQTCIVHLTRNTLKYVSHKDKYAFAQDLKVIYTSLDEVISKEIMYEGRI